jgi:drug/metabolite transporter (DMT)-like permease
LLPFSRIFNRQNNPQYWYSLLVANNNNKGEIMAANNNTSSIPSSSSSSTSTTSSSKHHHHHHQQNPTTLLTFRIIMLALVFSIAQIAQELISEYIFNKPHAHSTGETAMVYALFQQFAAMLTARILLLFEKDPGDTPKWSVVVGLAMLVYMSTAFANWALNWVFYPAKVIAKSAKLVPTMVVAVLMGNASKFAMSDYCAATLLCAGAAAFGLASGKTTTPSAEMSDSTNAIAMPQPGRDDTTSTSSQQSSSSSSSSTGSSNNINDVVTAGPLIGLLLLLMATTADALVPNLQQSTIRNGVNVEKLAFYVNGVGSAAILLILLISGEIPSWFEEWQADPESFFLMVGGGITSGVGVLCYFFLVAEAGSVVAVGVSTVRKVITVWLSFVLLPAEGKKFTSVHALGSVAVLAGIALGPLLKYLANQCAMVTKKQTIVAVTNNNHIVSNSNKIEDLDSEAMPLVEQDSVESSTLSSNKRRIIELNNNNTEHHSSNNNNNNS